MTTEKIMPDLYHQLLTAWNQRRPDDFAVLFTADAYVIGFDGSTMNGREEIAATLRQIFNDHQTAPYVGKVKQVRVLTPEVVVIHAIVGMIPLGQTDLNPAVNAHHTLTVIKQDEQWHIAVFQNTPAQFHGRPDLAQAFTEELRTLL